MATSQTDGNSGRSFSLASEGVITVVLASSESKSFNGPSLLPIVVDDVEPFDANAYLEPLPIQTIHN